MNCLVTRLFLYVTRQFTNNLAQANHRLVNYLVNRLFIGLQNTGKTYESPSEAIELPHELPGGPYRRWNRTCLCQICANLVKRQYRPLVEIRGKKDRV